MGERIEWVASESRFAELAEPWDLIAAAEPMPFARHAWFAAWWTAFGSGSTLAVCVLWRDGRLAGVLPLHGRGGRLEALANVHTPAFVPAVEDPAALYALVDAAVARGPVELVVPALASGSRTLAALRDRGRDARRLVLVEHQHTSPLIDLDGDFESFRRHSKPKWGAPLERFGRKMERENGARFSLVEPPVDLEEELQRGFEVEASGWKGAAGTAILSSPETLAFYREVARSFHAVDGLRLSGIRFGDRLVAFDLSLLHANRLWLLKTGYDESYRRLAPGLVLRLRIIARCYELGIEGHELLGDDSEWKRKFATGARRHETVRLYGRRPGGVARYGYRRALRPRLRQVYRRARAMAEARH